MGNLPNTTNKLSSLQEVGRKLNWAREDASTYFESDQIKVSKARGMNQFMF